MEFQDRETYFYEQTTQRKTPRRYKKLPEELPQDLRFAHLNPRVAAYLASKEKEKAEEVEDGLGNKSLLPQINQTVSLIRHRLDSLLSTDSDGHRALFEQAKHASDGILMQLAEILYLFEGLHIPISKSLEHALLNGWRDLIVNASHTTRDWQNPSNKEAWENQKRAQSVMSDRSSRPGSVVGGRTSVLPETTPRDNAEDKGKDGDGGSKRVRSKVTSRSGHLVGIAEDEELDPTEGASKKAHDVGGGSVSTMPKRRESQVLPKSKSRGGLGLHHLQSGHRPGSGRISTVGRRRDDSSVMDSIMSDGTRSVLGTTRDSGYYAVIQFQLSSKACEEKGWIIHPGGDEMDGDDLYEWAVQRLGVVLKAKSEQDQHDAENGCNTPIVLRFYGDKRKEELQKYKRTGSGREGSRRVGRGKLPRIPPMEPKLDPSKPVLMTTVSDGSSTVFYPSGRPAVVASRSQMGKPGFYTLVFDNNPEQTMLASFCPSGRGCCYHSNGVARFIAMETGGTMSDENGAITKRWDWPDGGAQAKLPIPIVVPLNHNLSFRCVNQHQMQVFFQCHKEQTKFSVGVMTGAEDPPQREEMGKLMTGYIFTSKAAKEFTKAYRSKPSKKGRSSKSKKGQSSIADLQKSLEITEPTENDVEADTVLIKLQRKAKNLVEGWQEHYRMALSITSPDLRALKDQPKKGRYINSAKSSPGGGGLVIIESISTQVPRPSVSSRVPSAPVEQLLKLSDELYRLSLSAIDYMTIINEGSTGRVTERPSPSTSPAPGAEVQQEPSPPAVKFDENPPEEFEAAEVMSITASTPFPASLFSRSVSSPGPRALRMKSAPQRLATTPIVPETIAPSTGLCPSALRMSYLGEENIQCRCSRHKLPYITDIEYDEFINHQAPEKQMVIVVVVSTLFPEATPAENMLESLYSEKNRNRTRPCLQSRQDAFRLILYDVATASDFSDHSQPLLLRRHNVVPGMYLMYEGGELLFCDHIFNGYGNARKDFQKQIMETRRMADQGYGLPKDFRFSPQQGRHGPRSAWGGQIGGAGVDRHAGAGVSMEQQVVKRSSFSSLSSSESDSSYNKHLHLRLTMSAMPSGMKKRTAIEEHYISIVG